MRILILIIVAVVVAISATGCGGGKKVRDRAEAHELFEAVTSLTKSYTARVEAAPDSAIWAMLCEEYEDSLDKVNFSFPPDTDLMLTEGQNDTITSLMGAYIKARDERIHSILYPVEPSDSIPTDSI